VIAQSESDYDDAVAEATQIDAEYDAYCAQYGCSDNSSDVAGPMSGPSISLDNCGYDKAKAWLAAGSFGLAIVAAGALAFGPAAALTATAMVLSLGALVVTGGGTVVAIGVYNACKGNLPRLLDVLDETYPYEPAY
jgi:hypothetical protein